MKQNSDNGAKMMTAAGQVSNAPRCAHIAVLVELTGLGGCAACH